MDNKKILLIAILILLVFSFNLAKAEAQTKVIRKTVKKVVAPEISPEAPPAVTTEEAVPEDLPPPPPAKSDYESQLPGDDKGIFGWDLNTDIQGKLLAGSILFGIRGNLVFADPFELGEKVGLAKDAVEYKIGTGFVISEKLKSIPLFVDTVVYLKEGSLFGMAPYLGAGFIFNLYGTDSTSGGIGGQVYLGILADFGIKSGKTGISLGYANYKVAEKVSDKGIFISITQPLKL